MIGFFCSITFANLAFNLLGVLLADKMHFLLDYCQQFAASKKSLSSLQKKNVIKLGSYKSQVKITFNKVRLEKFKLYYSQ